MLHNARSNYVPDLRHQWTSVDLSQKLLTEPVEKLCYQPHYIYGLIYTNYSILIAFLNCQFSLVLYSDSDVTCSEILQMQRKFVV